MKRSTRSELARETVSICERGTYLSAQGNLVQICGMIDRAVAQSNLCVLENTEATISKERKGTIRVTSETTLAALARLGTTSSGSIAALNFASAKNPGGGFLGGSEAQEESLARSSALYPCLLAVPEYYERNRQGGSALYLNLGIWSPSVPFFRNDDGQLLDEPHCASVITVPAPNAGAVRKNESARISEIASVLRRRAEFVLKIAAAHQVDSLVLGAWGCGVFRNDPAQVARVFRDFLCPPGPWAHAFDEVTFAIYDRSASQEVFQAFAPLASEPASVANSQ